VVALLFCTQQYDMPGVVKGDAKGMMMVTGSRIGIIANVAIPRAIPQSFGESNTEHRLGGFGGGFAKYAMVSLHRTIDPYRYGKGRMVIDGQQIVGAMHPFEQSLAGIIEFEALAKRTATKLAVVMFSRLRS